MIQVYRIILWGMLIANSPVSIAAGKVESLPEPFSLEQALEFADRVHPDLAISESRVQQAAADLLKADSEDDMDIRLQARAEWLEPSELSPYLDNDNHRLSLLVNKPLYDFGYQTTLIERASNSLQAQKYSHINTRQNRRLDIMKRYFDVLLADLNFYRYNEEMATAFVTLDKLRDRHELGQVSELDVLKQEVEYQKMRRSRIASINNQRLTRSALAVSLGNPDLIPDTVSRPDLPVLEKKLPEVEELQQMALTNNVTIKSLKARLDAAQQALEMARNSDNPTLTGQLEAHSYSRETASTDKWRAGIVLDIPLGKGGNTDASIANYKAKLYEAQANLKKGEVVLTQKVLELWLEMETIQARRTEMKTLADYSELYLDKSRALYEMEVRSTLGDAMITVTKAQYEALKTDLELAYAWAQMNALTGNMIDEH